MRMGLIGMRNWGFWVFHFNRLGNNLYKYFEFKNLGVLAPLNPNYLQISGYAQPSTSGYALIHTYVENLKPGN